MKRSFETINEIKKIKKGKYATITYKSVKEINGNHYEKITTGVYRFVDYASQKGVVVSGKQNPNEISIIPYILKFNMKTKSMLLMVEMTNNENHKPKSICYKNGVEIDKETYNIETKHKPSNYNAKMLTIKLENVISIQGVNA